MKNRYLLILLAAFFAAAYPVMSRAEGQEQQGSELFDGSSRYKALPAGSPSATLSPEALKEELRDRIAFNDHGSAKERAGYERMLTRLMESPTARREAEEFVKGDFHITFSFVEMPSSMVATVNGKKEVWGDRGVTYTNRVPPEIRVNALFLDYDRDRGVETFAHETFGHAVSASTLKGEDRAINSFAVTEEENARIIGWLVGAELGSSTEQEVWNYAANPGETLRDLAMAHPVYAIKLTTQEMADPLPVYRERLAKAEELLQTIPGREKRLATWDKAVRHFVAEHKMEESSFRNVRDILENSHKSLPDFRATLLKIKDALNSRIAYFSSQEGQAGLAILKKGASAEFLRERDEEILAYRRKLEGLLDGKTPQSSQPPPQAGQLTWDQFKELLKKDAASCEFGGIK